jgi:hypothetical protein
MQQDLSLPRLHLNLTRNTFDVGLADVVIDLQACIAWRFDVTFEIEIDCSAQRRRRRLG